jgi:hypothetical protein
MFDSKFGFDDVEDLFYIQSSIADAFANNVLERDVIKFIPFNYLFNCLPGGIGVTPFDTPSSLLEKKDLEELLLLYTI